MPTKTHYPMPLIEDNLPELKAFADAQAGRALEMYKIMNSTFKIIEDMEYHEMLGALTDECMIISNLK